MKRFACGGICFLLLPAALLTLEGGAAAQSSGPQRRIVQAIDESKLTTLRGNTHPFARPEFDRGTAPSHLPLERMLLVLKRSPDQEAALNKLMDEQQDVSSANFHKWLTPEEFGRQFGPSDEDIQTVTLWLESHGFQVAEVTPGRTLIEFSGDASRIEEAFHTEIHKYSVRGEEHWANASDPMIPTALIPVISGVASLNNFPRKPMSRLVGAFTKSTTKGNTVRRQPGLTVTGCDTGVLNATDCFVVGPTDLATIYNVLPLWNANVDGSGVTIAIVGDSNINIADTHNFRSIFGLPTNDPKVVLAGTEPRLNGDEIEANLDVQWSGAVATGANIDLVIAASTDTTFGGDIAAEFVINHNLGSILSESFSACELALGTTGNQMYNTLWQQAAAQGITVLVSTGDIGSSACEEFAAGLGVNGLASTPFDTGVGGTDFDQYPNPLLFWNATNNPSTQASATGYIPETTWNDSCTNQIWILLGYGPTPEANCNNPGDPFSGFPNVGIVGGSGGASNCISSSDGAIPTSCSGGYAKPSWQSGPGVPSDGSRDLPDVSLFSADGLLDSYYYLCEQDLNPQLGACSTSVFTGVGGTSVSAQVFASIVALIDQKTNSRQGLINPTLYALAAAEGNSCTSVANPSANCVFYDVVKGTNAQPCVVASTPDCPAPSNPAYTSSILSADGGVTEAYDAGPGFDLATGLGTVNVANLVNDWPTSGASAADFSVTSTSSTITIASPGTSGTATITFAAQSGFTGTIDLSSAACAALPAFTSCSFDKTSISLDGSNPTASTTLTVTTTAASALTPALRFPRFDVPNPFAVIAITVAFCIGILSLSRQTRWRAWGGALAVLLLALLIATTGCGGGSSVNEGGGNGGGGNGGGGGGGGVGGGGGGVVGTAVGSTNVVVTFTAGSSTHSLVLTVDVQ
jgi:subtilase family serine protease